jgi:hypothetical protein
LRHCILLEYEGNETQTEIVESLPKRQRFEVKSFDHGLTIGTVPVPLEKYMENKGFSFESTIHCVDGGVRKKINVE